jgi:replication-associated recombination protein RarA
MADAMNQDPWVNVRTRHGLPADEVISTLQKEIRRGNTENACLIAFEMMLTSAELEAYMWKRLLVISVEDVGFGDPQAPVLVKTLFDMHNVYHRNEGDRLLFGVQAVRYLCACKKDRSTDEMVNWMKNAFEREGLLPEIPDYALDMHTARGQEMGRGVEHFLTVGSMISPELEGRELTFRQRWLKLIGK